eukprot:CAMPEP_0114521000 /NCGR_PEP_ID=MMETSP0109-20121206/19939_1 /TAXON_ID=29199 /ORGANISM="Chlorarachnion reptans, Strain CCCM449" /LENGTH=110 /DNA_ID=CAMNT_0001702049 /DNA_START=271 /DNA_END=602 /DNA_ORIENTATION=+
MSDAPPKLPPKPLPSTFPTPAAPALEASLGPDAGLAASAARFEASLGPDFSAAAEPEPEPGKEGDDATEGHRAREGKIAAGGGQGSGRAQPSLKPSNPFAGGAAKPHRYA